MQKLCERLQTEILIKNVFEGDFPNIIKKVFEDERYKFYLNSELIDVNDRFRIFKYNNKNYIAKRTTQEDGKKEMELAYKAIRKLDGLIVDNYNIQIVKPYIYIIDDFAYILTEYMGNSLQEVNYSKTISNPLSLNTILHILELFLKKGVLYRGFLPRNLVVNNNHIYLLDWEDAVFDSNPIVGVNMLWKTNFILNWSYFYDYSILEKSLNKYSVSNSHEPPLLKYEEKFKKIANLNYSNVELRKCIFNTVMAAEKKINECSIDFIIPPNDMAHLVSDLYNSDIDVLFDISSSVLRTKSEFEYIKHLKELSEIIIKSYSKSEDISKNAIGMIFKFISSASECYVDYNLIINDKELFFRETKKVLNKLMGMFNKTNISEENFIRIANYFYSNKQEG